MTSNSPDRIDVSVTLVQGRDLVAKDRSIIYTRTTSDPYVKASLLNKDYGQTDVQYKTTSPVWNHKFQIFISGEDEINQALQSSLMLTIWDSDVRTKDDPMGVVMIPGTDLITISNGNEFTKWYTVQNGSPDKKYFCKNASGELQVSITAIKSMTSSTNNIDVVANNGNNTAKVYVPFNAAPSEVEEEIIMSMTEVAVSTPVPVSSEQNDIVLKSNKTMYYQGEMISVEFLYTKTIDGKFHQCDYIIIVPESTQQSQYIGSYIALENLSDDAGSSSGTKSFKIIWKPGKYKAVLFLDDFQTVLAVSNVFEVAQQSIVLSANQTSYDLGQCLEINFSTTSNVPFRENDYITIVSDSTSKNDYSSTFLAWESLRDDAGASNGTKSFLIKWKIGKYKAVLFLDGGQTILAVSNVFEVKQDTVALTTNQSSYELGQRMELNFSMSKTDGVPFRESDYVTIVREDATKGEYDSSYVAWERLGNEAESGTKSIKINWKVGRYKAVLFLEGGQIVLAVSNVFEVVKSPIVLKSSQPSYYVGQRLLLDFSTTGNVPFCEADYITIVSEDATKLEYDSVYVGWSNLGDEAGSSSGEKMFMIKWKPGRYKAVMFLEGGQTVLAVSNVFDVMSAPALLTSKQSSYNIGQTITLEFSSLVNVPFRNGDYITIVKENATENEYDSSYVGWQALGDEAGSSNGEIYIRIHWEVGRYKAVLFLDGGQVVLALSNVFEIK